MIVVNSIMKEFVIDFRIVSISMTLCDSNNFVILSIEIIVDILFKGICLGSGRI
jgi:hypothetical protein